MKLYYFCNIFITKSAVFVINTVSKHVIYTINSGTIAVISIIEPFYHLVEAFLRKIEVGFVLYLSLVRAQSAMPHHNAETLAYLDLIGKIPLASGIVISALEIVEIRYFKH